MGKVLYQGRHATIGFQPLPILPNAHFTRIKVS
jgi:hypothetical protein